MNFSPPKLNRAPTYRKKTFNK